jgi:CHASE3 domain sensor protein
MTTNDTKSNFDEIKIELEKIKSALNMQTKTTTVFDEIKTQIKEVDDKINDRLTKIEKQEKKASLLTVAVFAGSYVISGAVLFSSVIQYSRPYWFGLGLMVAGLIAFVWAYDKDKSVR